MTTGGWSGCACSIHNPGTHPPDTFGAGDRGRTDSRLRPPQPTNQIAPVAHLDRKCLQRSSASRRPHSTRQRPEHTLGTPHNRAGADVAERRVPRALQASIVSHAPLPERGEQVATAVRDRERHARTHANARAPCGVCSTTSTCEAPRSSTVTSRTVDCSEALTRSPAHTSDGRLAVLSVTRGMALDCSLPDDRTS